MTNLMETFGTRTLQDLTEEEKCKLLGVMCEISDLFFSCLYAYHPEQATEAERDRMQQIDPRGLRTASGLALTLHGHMPHHLAGPWGSMTFPYTGMHSLHLVQFLGSFVMKQSRPQGRVTDSITDEIWYLFGFQELQLPPVTWPPSADDLVRISNELGLGIEAAVLLKQVRRRPGQLRR